MNSEEPMDVESSMEFDKFDDLLEEGEYVESNRVSRKTLPTADMVPQNKYDDKAGTFVTGIDVFSKEAKVKMEERAKRFGLSKSISTKLESLNESFGIIEGTENAKNYRLNCIHMRGTENMSTKDVFKYFEDYAPDSVEWINDVSCNIVWLDKHSAARAMLGLSKKILGIKREPIEKVNSHDSDEDSVDITITNGKQPKEESTIHIKDIRCPLPPGIWRKGHNYMDSRNIFLRFATRSDKKQVQAEKMSEYYKKHGNPNLGGLKGILTTSRKRMYKQTKESSPSIKSESETNGKGIAAKNPWGSLSKTWGVADVVEDDYLPKTSIEPVSDVKKRLGYRSQNKESDEDIVKESDSNVIELSEESKSESSSDDENWCKRSKMPRMRMHADDEEEKIQKRKGKIRNMAYNTAYSSSNDLRGRLTAKRRLPQHYQEEIQVVVTNPKLIQSNFRNFKVSEDEDEDDEIIVNQDDDEEEEGEIVDDSESDSKVEYEDEEDEIENEEVSESESQSQSQSDDSSSSSSVSEKEVQGPRGSVIKVVQHKPKLQSTVSTVWSRLNHSKINDNESPTQNRHHSKADLRHTLRKTDLRSRIGNHHMRGRSPLRIELRNDKYAGRYDDSD